MPETRRPISLTGIKPTGVPHLGNYVGAIRPALKLVEDYDAFYFIADYHALISVRDRELLDYYTRSVAATWLACGLDPEVATFYRQSDIPETFELTWVFACMTPKGLMNRAHAYKATRDKNRKAGLVDLDAGINMGLYNYPILMAVDILIMEADVVPVGKDQIQHVEIARDIAGSFNHAYGDKYEFKLPRNITSEDEDANAMPGLDGRKMSKSYNNTIPLFCERNELRKLVRRIKTDSTPVDAPKDPDSSSLFSIYKQFASEEDQAKMRERMLAGGLGWGEMKDMLFEQIDAVLAESRERYKALMEDRKALDEILASGAERARARARRVLESVRAAIGID
ncbi:tryptophan--tRNA ligase [Carbonactinospora thermoautotrophica]|uniref:tryptophan--tRNA ligase n=1 Tax=Carbonactinospora thermoautotrophica TaxID=1469144 RepID=UPI0022703013|nr:tryptophan--tRNA ligase [Carbonactinospora thermoautotrophica]MCX9192969.1 tryptophan--tRNA ligase [Carbonactinospora thermoautotrophica]